MMSQLLFLNLVGYIIILSFEGYPLPLVFQLLLILINLMTRYFRLCPDRLVVCFLIVIREDSLPEP